ncbi:proton-coupled folate transporter-like isoform X1 [Tigriopus californicus]|uniref:proton-coupled folate transporter-like isoform X1 n=2 Tax=Tigriopus californicus TaxID=6832 RepID=UPI0027D9FF06|nr:proton-coupled folate transporter-like isoform X1 [Tigriopus californicus]
MSKSASGSKLNMGGTFWAKAKHGPKKILDNITIEPMIILFNFSDALDMLSLDQLKIEKTCIQKFNYTSEMCSNLVEYEDANLEVQNYVAQFNVYVTVIVSIFPAILAFYMGAWCDLIGRKVIMLAFFSAKALGAAFLVCYSHWMDMPLEYFFVAMAIPSIMGGDPAFNMSVYSFISDISRPEQRAFRMGMIHISTKIFRPFALPLGAWLLREGSFVAVTATSCGGFALGGFLLWLRLRSFNWTPVKSDTDSKRNMFHPYHVWDSITTIFKPRPNHRRMYLLLLMGTMISIYAPFQGEKNVSYFYVRTRFGWEVDEYSNYNTFQQIVSTIGQVIAIPILAYYDISETLSIIIMVVTTMIRHIVQGLATQEWLFYLGALIDLMDFYPLAVTRALISSCAPKHELGKVLALNSSLEGLVPLIISQIYASIWQASSNGFIGAIYIFSASMTAVGQVFSIFIHVHLKGQRLAALDQSNMDEETDAINKDTIMYDTRLSDLPPTYHDLYPTSKI